MKPLDLTWRNNVLWLLANKLSGGSDNFLTTATVLSPQVKAISAINVPSRIMNKKYLCSRLSGTKEASWF